MDFLQGERKKRPHEAVSLSSHLFGRYIFTISSKSFTKSLTASSLVAQEVQKRRQVCDLSGLHWKVVRYFLLICSASSSGKTGKIWFVGASHRRGIPRFFKSGFYWMHLRNASLSKADIKTVFE